MSNNKDTPMTDGQAQGLSDMLHAQKRTPVVAPQPEVQTKVEEVVEEPTNRKPKAKKGLSHRELFVQEVGMTARYGKAVYIRKEFHERIQKIVQIVGANEVTLYSYIDNVLAQHFNTYQDEITKEYDASIGGLF